MKRVLVAGGAGFIGSHLCARLLDDGHQVLCLDNYLTGTQQNVSRLLPHPRFELIHHDVEQRIDRDIDCVFNLACPASPIHYQRDPIATVKTNVLGTLNLLSLCLEHGATFFQASTSEVYGDPQVHPQSEEYRGHVNPIGPRACYDEGKRLAETLCMEYHRQHGVNVRIARIFNTYGPHTAIEDGRVVSNFVLQALKEENLTVFGEGQQSRSFCYIDDLVEALILWMAHDDPFPGPINLGNPEELTVLELAEKVVSLTGSRSSLVFQALPSDDPQKRCPDITRATTHLGWSPTVGIDEGLRRTIAYFKERLDAL